MVFVNGEHYNLEAISAEQERADELEAERDETRLQLAEARRVLESIAAGFDIDSAIPFDHSGHSGTMRTGFVIAESMAAKVANAYLAQPNPAAQLEADARLGRAVRAQVQPGCSLLHFITPDSWQFIDYRDPGKHGAHATTPEAALGLPPVYDLTAFDAPPTEPHAVEPTPEGVECEPINDCPEYMELEEVEG